MTHHLALHDILTIRDGLVYSEEDQFRFELVNAPGLISALTTPFQVTFGTPSFPALTDKAAALTFLLIANHPFRDGNKRIAGAALRLFLQRNARPLHANPADLQQFTEEVMHSQLRDAHIAAWIDAHSHPA
jgi:death-on-curing protein